MNLRHLTSLAAIFVAGLCMADEPPADPAPPSRPYVHNAWWPPRSGASHNSRDKRNCNGAAGRT